MFINKVYRFFLYVLLALLRLTLVTADGFLECFDFARWYCFRAFSHCVPNQIFLPVLTFELLELLLMHKWADSLNISEK